MALNWLIMKLYAGLTGSQRFIQTSVNKYSCTLIGTSEVDPGNLDRGGSNLQKGFDLLILPDYSLIIF